MLNAGQASSRPAKRNGDSLESRADATGWPTGSELAAVVFDFHALDTWEHSRDVVVIDDLQYELNVGEHDISGARRDQIKALPVLLSRLDGAFGKLPPELVGADDEASAMNAREFGEADLPRASTPNKHLVTLIGVGRPRPG